MIPFAATTYKPQLVEHVRKTCYKPHSVMLGGVPNTNHNSYSQHKSNTSLATTCDAQSSEDPSYKPQLAHSQVTLVNLSHN